MEQEATWKASLAQSLCRRDRREQAPFLAVFEACTFLFQVYMSMEGLERNVFAECIDGFERFGGRDARVFGWSDVAAWKPLQLASLTFLFPVWLSMSNVEYVSVVFAGIVEAVGNLKVVEEKKLRNQGSRRSKLQRYPT